MHCTPGAHAQTNKTCTKGGGASGTQYSGIHSTYPKMKRPAAMTMKLSMNVPNAKTSRPRHTSTLKMMVPSQIPNTLSNRKPPNTDRTTLGQEYSEYSSTY